MFGKYKILLFLTALFFRLPAWAAVITGGSGEEGVASAGGDEFFNFLRWLFPAMLGVAALLAVGSIAFAGFMWIGAAGNPAAIENAKDRIWNALLGLLLAFAAWLILNTINPALVSL